VHPVNKERCLASYLTHLQCSGCGNIFSFREKHSTCPECHSTLLARYGLCQISDSVNKKSIHQRNRGIWRWQEFLPIENGVNQISLGEGDTPFIRLCQPVKQVEFPYLYCKDESNNPAGSHTARGLCVAISKAVELGVTEIVLPTTGNSGGAAAAYAARSGLQAHIYMPKQSLQIHRNEVVDYGGHLHLVDGTIDQANQQASADSQEHGWYNLATFREPYGVEGNKTIGFEIAEYFEWVLPDWIIYPISSGSSLVGMWKAFQELAEMGWIEHKLPRFVAIQTRGNTPIVKAYNEALPRPTEQSGPSTSDIKLNDPMIIAKNLIFDILKETNGLAIDVKDEEKETAQIYLSKREGILFSSEGAATYAGISHLVEDGSIRSDHKILIINTDSGLKYL
jgi:threonine synthase